MQKKKKKCFANEISFFVIYSLCFVSGESIIINKYSFGYLLLQTGKLNAGSITENTTKIFFLYNFLEDLMYRYFYMELSPENNIY